MGEIESARELSCASCHAALSPQLYGRCPVCEDAVFCLSCARGHLCTLECAARGCYRGLCVRVVRDGVVAANFGIPNDR